jgi:hypothetical protein
MTSAVIKAWNRTSDYVGAGTQLSARAMSTISGFASAQSPGRSPNIGVVPGALTFANSSGYGGNYGSAPACTGFAEDLPAETITSGSIDLAGESLGENQSVTRRVNGSAYITNNIVYSSTNWSNVAGIPRFKLIADGDIYISGDVTQLDGMYVSLTGRIFTCATGNGSVPTDSFDRCKKQLVVNGVLAARQVWFLRGCGTLKYAAANERTLTAGNTATDDQRCSTTNAAAEIINYAPEQWITSTVGPAPDRYDAVTAMPPVF